MNDRFRLRLYNKSSNEMYKVHSLHIGTDNAIISCKYGNKSISLKDCVLMQCTGLKDKNGTLIYERDIIKIGKCTYEVKYNPEGYWQVGDFLLSIFNTEKVFEVIGNIYENPELLKGENNERQI